MTIINQEALEERANNLGTFNGLEMVLVDLIPQPNPTQAILTVNFFNNKKINAIFTTINADPAAAKDIFSITGGHRILGGPMENQVQVKAAAKVPGDNTVLKLTVEPIGDYSTYTLSVNFDKIDPFLSEIKFKFRPGCFNYCAPEIAPSSAPKQGPIIDYLAKDYDSFRHTMMTWMSNSVPDWQPTSEADLDQTLLELFSAAADEISYFQDGVMKEGSLLRARKRVSIARHARLMDYHIHQGNQASTWLAMEVNTAGELDTDFQAATGEEVEGINAVVFMPHAIKKNGEKQDKFTIDPLLNEISLYTWDDAVPALAAGATQADLQLKTSGKPSAEKVQDLIRDEEITHLLIQEHLNPLTGEERGRDPSKRQLLKLLAGNEGAEAMQDPVVGEWFVRVYWEEEDQLKSAYCFTAKYPDIVPDVSMFHGNLVKVYQGKSYPVTFKEKPSDPNLLLISTDNYYERLAPFGSGRYKSEAICEPPEGDIKPTSTLRVGSQTRGTICELPEGPLAYKDTQPGGNLKPESTLNVTIKGSGADEEWEEVISLIHSDEQADHFIVETDELGRSLIRFGDGVNGRELPEDAEVECTYQIAYGPDGNIGADALKAFDEAKYPKVAAIWNPFDVTNGLAPEPVEEIIRRAPQAYRYKQLRAITLQDYIDRAEEVKGVSKAAARYMWTGNWRTVQVTIDPVGTSTLKDELRETVYKHLDAVRLIGEDLEIRDPEYVPLDITVSLCIHSDYWPEDIKFLLEEKFSENYTPDGSLGFFHPDRWTFGQPLRASEITGRVQAIQGVDHVTKITMKRWHQTGDGLVDSITAKPNEILQVRNNRDHMEDGFINFNIQGGRQ